MLAVKAKKEEEQEAHNLKTWYLTEQWQTSKNKNDNKQAQYKNVKKIRISLANFLFLS